MTDEEIMKFVKLVVKTLQTDQRSVSDCKRELTKILDEADEIALKLTGNKIVVREKTLLESITGSSKFVPGR